MSQFDKFVECTLDSARGVYIPRDAAESLDWTKARGVKPESLDILRAGPEHESYWDEWTQVLDNAEFTDSNGDDFILHNGESGDLFLVNVTGATRLLDSIVCAQCEHEESHVNAGAAYEHMPREGDSTEQAKRLAQYLLNSFNMVLAPDHLDALHDFCLDNFKMESGHIFSGDCDGFALDSYPVGEIEIDLQDDSDSIAFEYARAKADSHVTESGLAYQTSDCVWFARISDEKLRAGITETATQ